MRNLLRCSHGRRRRLRKDDRRAGRDAAPLGPGLANRLANLHNARRACVPLLNIVGDHAGHLDGSDDNARLIVRNLAVINFDSLGIMRSCTAAPMFKGRLNQT